MLMCFPSPRSRLVRSFTTLADPDRPVHPYGYGPGYGDSQIQALGDAEQIHPRADAQLRVHVGQVCLHRALADEQALTDLAGGQTADGKADDLAFPAGRGLRAVDGGERAA